MTEEKRLIDGICVRWENVEIDERTNQWKFVELFIRFFCKNPMIWSSDKFIYKIFFF